MAFLNNGTFPFLENERLKLNIAYEKDTVFRQVWTNDTARQEAPDPNTYVEMVTEDFIANLTNKAYNVSEMSLNDCIKTGMLFGLITNLDVSSIYCAIHGDNDSCSKITSLPYLDSVLKNHSSLEALQHNLWAEIQSNIRITRKKFDCYIRRFFKYVTVVFQSGRGLHRHLPVRYSNTKSSRVYLRAWPQWRLFVDF